MKETVKHFFNTHTESNEVFETSDGFLFHGREMATSHSFSLNDKNVKEYKRSEMKTALVKEDISLLERSIQENEAITEAKDAELLHSVASGQMQQRAEDQVSEIAEETVKTAIDELSKDVPTGTEDVKDQANKNATAIAGNAAAEAGAGKVKTTVTPPVKKVIAK